MTREMKLNVNETKSLLDTVEVVNNELKIIGIDLATGKDCTTINKK